MEAIFLRDNNDDVWFSYARDIQYRWTKVKQTHPDLIDKDSKKHLHLL